MLVFIGLELSIFSSRAELSQLFGDSGRRDRLERATLLVCRHVHTSRNRWNDGRTQAPTRKG
jgi:hypothetical protein